MTSTIRMSSLLLAFCCLGLATAFSPFSYLPIPVPPPRSLFKWQQDGLLSPNSLTPFTRRPTTLGQIRGEFRYTNTPVQILAGFSMKPPFPNIIPPMPLPKLIPNFIPDLKQLEENIFKPNKIGERAETPGQTTNYEEDLKELEKETSQNEINSSSDGSGEITSIDTTSSSYVSVGITGPDNKEYGYNYSV